MQIGRRQKWLFIGDSITDCGRTQPVAEGLFDPLGRGYVTQIEALLGAAAPELGIRVVNVGSSGNTVRDLKDRWDRDVLALKPDWLSVAIGINDVWRQFDLPRAREKHVGLDEYERVYDELLARTRAGLQGLVLVTPYLIEPNRQEPMRARMDQYGAVVKRLARKYDAVFADTQTAFDRMLKHMHPMALAWDRIHPNQTGHMVIARTILNAVGYEW
jgi:lysophospholipase L1-like esterase